MSPARPSHASAGVMPIDVVSDVVCPWCYIGKRRLEKALAMRPEIAAEVRWRPYFLNPWIPREGIDRKAYLETKFGSVERYAAIAERVAAAARSEGLEYAHEKIARQPNTLDCHRLILWARNTSDAGRMKQRLMELYFAEGADLVRKLLASDADVERIERESNAAKEAGVDGVPCFIFANATAVAGAQDPAYLAGAIRRAATEHAKRAAGRDAEAEARPG